MTDLVQHTDSINRGSRLLSSLCMGMKHALHTHAPRNRRCYQHTILPVCMHKFNYMCKVRTCMIYCLMLVEVGQCIPNFCCTLASKNGLRSLRAQKLPCSVVWQCVDSSPYVHSYVYNYVYYIHAAII